MKIHCPSDTRELITDRSRRVNRHQISNFSLFYRYFLDEVDNKFGLQTQQPDEVPKFADPEGVFSGQRNALEHLRNRQTDQLRYLASSGQWLAPRHFYCATSRLDWRMIVGLGSSHVQETNMTLDHIYGIPYLPGSAFKGVVRSWVIQEHFCNDEKLATRDIEDSDPNDMKEKKDEFFEVFGGQKASGKVHFLDVLPAENVRFELDIMNPHFSDYYKGTTFPTDDQDPNPIYFLTLKELRFRFLIYAEAAASLQLAKNWFVQAIENRGFGAKSAGGYGYFRELDDKTQDIKEEFTEKLSLDEAYNIYQNYPDQRESIHIDIEKLVDYAPKFAIIVTEEICDIAQIGSVDDIHKTLILIEETCNMVVPSEFGKWVWEKTRDKLFEGCLEYPNLTYSRPFRNAFPSLLAADRELLQEQLMKISKDFLQKLNKYSPQAEDLIEIAEDLENEFGKFFQDLPLSLRIALVGKLLNIATDLDGGTSLLIDSLDNEYKGEIGVAGGYTIQCTGVNENGSLQLRNLTKPLSK